jgi:hypothetical protein
VRSGRLHRLHRGVFALGHTNLSWHGRCLAAVLACGPNALLGHHSAAWLWGISTRKAPGPLAVTVPMPRSSRSPIELHRARNLAEEDRALHEGIPLTSMARTLLDLAAGADAGRIQRYLERADELRLFDLTPVESVLARNVGHPGAHRLGEALGIYREPPFTRSQLERRFVELVVVAGLPRPSTGFVAAGYELDVYWPGERFAVELDTFETHGSRAAFERDRIRQEDLKLAGIEMTRVTAHRLAREPGKTIERVAALLGRRRSEIGLRRDRTGDHPVALTQVD